MEESKHHAWLRPASLVLLTLQNAALILTMRYVRTREGDMFMAPTAIVISELLKLVVCLMVIFYLEGGLFGWARHLKQNIIDNPKDCLLISVPSFVYVIQNNLLFVAASHLEASTSQVLYQLKILTTALFAVLILRKQLSRMQWFSLVLLFVGVSIVGLQLSGDAKNAPAATVSPTASVEARAQNPILGLVCISIACLLSGFAGIWLEKMLKGTPPSLWLRNVQLGFLGVLFGYGTLLVNNGGELKEKSFFFGYDCVVMLVIVLHGLGGLLVAVVVKYADNILKGFATSIAIILSCVTSIALFDFHPTLLFIVGSALVILSVDLYGRFPFKPDDAARCEPPPKI